MRSLNRMNEWQAHKTKSIFKKKRFTQIFHVAIPFLHFKTDDEITFLFEHFHYNKKNGLNIPDEEFDTSPHSEMTSETGKERRIEPDIIVIITTITMAKVLIIFCTIRTETEKNNGIKTTWYLNENIYYIHQVVVIMIVVDFSLFFCSGHPSVNGLICRQRKKNTIIYPNKKKKTKPKRSLTLRPTKMNLNFHWNSIFLWDLISIIIPWNYEMAQPNCKWKLFGGAARFLSFRFFSKFLLYHLTAILLWNMQSK